METRKLTPDNFVTSEPQFPHHWEAPIPEAVRGLIFDCDGTLVDTMPSHYRAWRRALDAVGIHISEQRFYAFAGLPTSNIIATLAEEQGIACDIERVGHEKERIYLENLETLEAITNVAAIARREFGRRKLAVASGGWRRVVEKSLEVAGIATLFETIVGSDDVPRGKPSPDVFLEAARRLELRPEECLVYEDGELGILAAEAAGMAVIDVRPWQLPNLGLG